MTTPHPHIPWHLTGKKSASQKSGVVQPRSQKAQLSVILSKNHWVPSVPGSILDALHLVPHLTRTKPLCEGADDTAVLKAATKQASGGGSLASNPMRLNFLTMQLSVLPFPPRLVPSLLHLVQNNTNMFRSAGREASPGRARS